MKTHPHQLSLVLSKAIQNKAFEQAVLAVEGLRSIDLADALKLLETNQSWQLLEHLPKGAEVFSYFPLATQLSLAGEMPQEILAKLFSQMPADRRTDFFKCLPYEQQENLLAALDVAEQEAVYKLASYVEGTAGALMTSDFVRLKPAMTVAEAIKHLRSQSTGAETIYHAYVTDTAGKLLGVVSLRDLISADLEQPIQDLMVSVPVSADVYDHQEDIAKMIARYDLIALPITNLKGVLVGIVTYDDALDVVSEEATEDIHKSAGVSAITGRLKDASIGLLYRKRVFWLVLLVFGNLFSGAGIAHFEDIIAANLVLVFFLPLLVDSGGNAGSQSATLMVRALATGEVVMKDWLYLIGREALVALALGGTMALAVALLGFIRGDEVVALVLALSMVSIVLIGSIIGMSLPFLLNKFKLDPATASAPLITSVCDAVGVLVYLYIAAQLLSDISIL